MNDIIIWIGFLFSLTLLILIARKSFWLGMLIGALVLGLFNLSIREIAYVFWGTVSDPSIILLAISVGIIPLIGGIMEESHLIEWLVQNLRIGKKGSLMLSPAIFGMLPMPGGALLSAPMVERTGEGVKSDMKAVINVWFRHLLIFVYPLGALLPTTKMANLNLYREIPYLIPFFFVIFILGYLFMIRGVRGEINYKDKFELKGLLIPLGIIMGAPIIHFSLMRIFKIGEIALLIGVSISFILAFIASRLKMREFPKVIKKMRPWNYTLIIFGMFLFLNIFKSSDMSDVIAKIAFTPAFLIVGIGAFLGFVTGRVQLPVSILLPIFYSKYGEATMTPTTFAIMFFSILMGYMISPIHPCVLVSIEYFKTNIKDYMKTMASSVIISLVIAAIVSMVLI
jgi:integral membrane protein (TIGR00529 family)